MLDISNIKTTPMDCELLNIDAYTAYDVIFVIVSMILSALLLIGGVIAWAINNKTTGALLLIVGVCIVIFNLVKYPLLMLLLILLTFGG